LNSQHPKFNKGDRRFNWVGLEWLKEAKGCDYLGDQPYIESEIVENYQGVQFRSDLVVPSSTSDVDIPG
jgi:hypothetical protein